MQIIIQLRRERIRHNPMRSGSPAEKEKQQIRRLHFILLKPEIDWLSFVRLHVMSILKCWFPFA